MAKARPQPRKKRDVALEELGRREPNLTRPGSVGTILLTGRRMEMTPTGMKIIEVRQVTDLDPDSWLTTALFQPGIPKPWLNDTHPVFRGLPCQRTIAEPLDNGSTPSGAKVTSEYHFGESGFGGWVDPDTDISADLEINTILQPMETNLHYVGDTNDAHERIILAQEFDVAQPGEPSQFQTVTNSPVVEGTIALTEFVYRRREWWERTSGSPLAGQTVGDIARNFVGSLNNEIVFQNDPIYSWMCTGIIGVSSDSGLTYDVTYQFQHHPHIYTQKTLDEQGNVMTRDVGGWCIPVGILDENGYPRTDLENGTGTPGDGSGGLAYVRVNKANRFDDLQLYLY